MKDSPLPPQLSLNSIILFYKFFCDLAPLYLSSLCSFTDLLPGTTSSLAAHPVGDCQSLSHFLVWKKKDLPLYLDSPLYSSPYSYLVSAKIFFPQRSVLFCIRIPLPHPSSSLTTFYFDYMASGYNIFTITFSDNNTNLNTMSYQLILIYTSCSLFQNKECHLFTFM